MNTKCILSLAAILAYCCCSNAQSNKLHTIECDTYDLVDAFLAYSPGCRMIVSGHRGGIAPGYPENSIEAFEYTLSHMESFFEIDPRMTKDSVMVLMHDKTIDRTTTGKGAVSDYTYEQLLEFNLVDKWGNVTPYKIPTVEQAVLWSQGKTILNFDLKDVTRDVLIPFVNSLGARNCIYTVRNARQARFCYDIDPEVRLSAWIKDMDAFREYDAAGIPWSRYIVYVVSTTMDPDNAELYEALRSNGVRCMISMSPSHDRIEDREARIEEFKKEVALGPDIIETDFPTDFIGLY